MDKQSGCAGIRHYVMWLQFCPRSRLSKSDTFTHEDEYKKALQLLALAAQQKDYEQRKVG